MSGLAPEVGQVVTVSDDKTEGRTISGRVIDGLGRPVAAVKLEVMSTDEGRKEPLAVATTGEDGRFACQVGSDSKEVRIHLEKAKYVYFSETRALPLVGDLTMNRRRDWEEFDLLPWAEGDDLDRGLRELLASEDGPDTKPVEVIDWSEEGDEVDINQFIFKHQGSLMPAIRRQVGDPSIGAKARYWIDWLGDPSDRDLFPVKRQFAPRHEIAEEDLIEAIKAISSHLNFFSSAPEPAIDIEKLTFTPKLDRVFVECGINLGPMTGVFWHFIFHKEGKKWVLRSMYEAGRG